MASTSQAAASSNDSGDSFPSRRLFISGFDVNVVCPEEKIRKIFGKFGEVTCLVWNDENKTCFLTYNTREETLTALLNKDLVMFGDCQLNICEATPKKTQLFVGGLKSDVNDEMLRDKFAEYGQIHDANVKIDPRTGYSRCFGFVTFVDCDHVCDMLTERRFMEFGSKTIEIKPATPITDYFRQIKQNNNNKRQNNFQSNNQQMLSQQQMMQQQMMFNPMYHLNQQMMQMNMGMMNPQMNMGMMNPQMMGMPGMMPPMAMPQMQQMPPNMQMGNNMQMQMPPNMMPAPQQNQMQMPMQQKMQNPMMQPMQQKQTYSPPAQNNEQNNFEYQGLFFNRESGVTFDNKSNESSQNTDNNGNYVNPFF